MPARDRAVGAPVCRWRSRPAVLGAAAGSRWARASVRCGRCRRPGAAPDLHESAICAPTRQVALACMYVMYCSAITAGKAQIALPYRSTRPAAPPGPPPRTKRSTNLQNGAASAATIGPRAHPPVKSSLCIGRAAPQRNATATRSAIEQATRQSARRRRGQRRPSAASLISGEDRRRRRPNRAKSAVRPPAASKITSKSGDCRSLYASHTHCFTPLCWSLFACNRRLRTGSERARPMRHVRLSTTSSRSSRSSGPGDDGVVGERRGRIVADSPRTAGHAPPTACRTSARCRAVTHIVEEASSARRTRRAYPGLSPFHSGVDVAADRHHFCRFGRTSSARYLAAHQAHVDDMSAT